MFVGVVPICQDILRHPGSEEPWMTTMRRHHLAVEWWDLTKNCGWFIESYPANMRISPVVTWSIQELVKRHGVKVPPFLGDIPSLAWFYHRIWVPQLMKWSHQWFMMLCTLKFPKQHCSCFPDSCQSKLSISTAEEYFPQTFKPSAAFLFFGPILRFRVKRQQQEIMETVSLIHELVVLRDLYWVCHTVTSKNGERVSKEHTEM